MKQCKRILSILLTALLLALTLSLFTAAQAAVSCNGNHEWSGWQGIGATCDTAGSQERRCYRCGTVDRQTIPALGHSWNGGAVTAQPSCTSGGTRVYTCTRSGATRTEGIGALGHSYGVVQVTKPSTCASMGESFQVCSRCGDRVTHVMPKNENHSWDEGVITREPEGFTPGEKTYTCTLCGATRTEEVEPVTGIFNKLNMSLRNVPPPSGNPAENPLHIVTHPEGGTLPFGSFEILRVEAAGGEEPYTYEWWYESDALQLGMGVSPSALADLVYGQGVGTTGTVQQNRDNLKPAVINSTTEWFRNHHLSDSTIAELTEKSNLEATQQESTTFSPFAKKLRTSTDPECEAGSAGSYWCVVYDSAGNHVTSNRAHMTDELYIAVQPESQNIFGIGSATLSCRAGGGSGQYAYSWYGENGIMGTVLEDGPSFTTNQPGTYVCYAVDFNTAEMVESNIVQVYSNEATQVNLRPVITMQPSNVMLAYREDGQYSWQMTCEAVAYDGDTEHLRYHWSGKTDNGWAPITENQVLRRSYDHGIFRCRVEDTRSGQSVNSEEVKVNVAMILIDGYRVSSDYITEDIHGNEIRKADYYYRFYVVGGSAPYTVELYRRFNYKDTLIERCIVKSVDELLPFERKLPNVYTITVMENGQEKEITGAPLYYLVITDCDGNVFRTSYVG